MNVEFDTKAETLEVHFCSWNMTEFFFNSVLKIITPTPLFGVTPRHTDKYLHAVERVKSQYSLNLSGTHHLLWILKGHYHDRRIVSLVLIRDIYVHI
jgi:hypothetical protein